MLLRSSSTPILNSWIPHSKETTLLKQEIIHQKIPRNRSVTLSLPPTPPLVTAEVVSMKKKMMTRASSSQTNLRKLPVAEKNNNYDNSAVISLLSVEAVEKVENERLTLDRLFPSSGLLEEGGKVGGGNKGLVNVMVGGGGSGGGGYGGSGWHGGDGGKSWEWDSNHGNNNSMEVYYEQMIEANPGNALLLSNYARFLKEVRGDYVKSEEYCGRAILENPSDADVLSFYAHLIWQSHKDASRAKSYFDQAVKASPNCYVLASYARFLWDTEENEDEQEKLEEEKQETITKKSSPPRFLKGLGGLPPLPP